MDLEQYRDRARSMRLWALLWLVLGLPIFSLGGASFVLGALIAAFPRSIPDDDVFIGIGALLAIGVGLGLLGGIPCMLGLRLLLERRRLRMETARERLGREVEG